MKKKIDIAEILKDCPRGMELDSPMFEGLEFDGIVDDDYFSIRCRIKHPDGGNNYNFTKYGCWTGATFSKCVIFPKGKTTWEGFVPPYKFKDGDILYARDEGNEFIFILKHIFENGHVYCYLSLKGDDLRTHVVWLTDYNPTHRLATEEEKEKLFHAIKAKGYKWNAETKTLEKLIIPMFKVGYRIKYKGDDAIGRIEKIDDNVYHVDCSFDDGVIYVNLADQDKYELVHKFDISTLKPFESKVLVRDSNVEKWRPATWGYYDKDSEYNYPYEVVGGHGFSMCIPYEGNEHLIGTTNDCDEFYKTW